MLARIALTLLLLPPLVTPVQAFLTGDEVTGGGETARWVVWAGFLYLVYRGFRLIRWLVLLYATVVVVLTAAGLIRNTAEASLQSVLVGVAFIATMATGLALLLSSSVIRAFLIYQLGGKVAEPQESHAPRRTDLS